MREIGALAQKIVKTSQYIPEKTIGRFCQIIANQTMPAGISTQFFFFVHKITQFIKSYLPCFTTEKQEAINMLEKHIMSSHKIGTQLENLPKKESKNLIREFSKNIFNSILEINETYPKSTCTKEEASWAMKKIKSDYDNLLKSCKTNAIAN